ncbi:MAG: hypothetical protein JWM32_1388 [Verrucomicrobia bacterium]|nr:hypothetical protein [Verrucomicrobiota bacterium]
MKSTEGPLASQEGCPRCGAGLTPSTAGKGVCLPCAGARVLSFDWGATVPAGEAFESGTGTGDAAFDGLPARIADYEIIEELGRGGMGRIFAAQQVGLGRIVALKAITAGASGATDLERRFLREAQTIARLRHPNIVAVHDFGRANGFAYFTMDYIEGGDVAQAARSQGYTPREAAALVQKVAGALAYTHGEGVLHRDLKPSNILLDRGEPRVADFGLASQLEPGGDLTAVSGIVGTPHYLSPEAMHGGTAAQGVAGDIYALGVILFELCTGRTPFAGASPVELAAIVATTEPPSPRLLAPAMPVDLETICLKCLEREPGRRYANMMELAEDLRRFLAGEAILARPISAPARFLRWCRRRPALAAVWVLITALAVGSTVAAARINRERERAEQALTAAQAAESSARERLREARLAQARAVRRTTVAGRREQALAALAEAARIRPGADLRDEALAALLLPDIRALERWELAPSAPGEINFDAAGTLASVEPLDAEGLHRGPAVIRRWREKESVATLAVPGTTALGRLRFSPDGKWVMARYRDSTVRVWRIGTAAPVVTIAGRPAPGEKIETEIYNDDYDFSPDGARFAVGLPEGGISVHRTEDGKELVRWVSPAKLHTLRFSPDGARIAGAILNGGMDHPAVFVLTSAKLEFERSLTIGDEVGSLTWTPDSRVIAVALRQNLIASYDVRDGRLLQKFSSVARNPRDLVYLGREDLMAVRGSGTTTMHLLNPTRGEDEVLMNNIGASFITTVPGSSSFIVSDNTTQITRWEVMAPTGFRTVPPPRPSGYERIGDSGALDFSADGRWDITSAIGVSMVRDVHTGRLAGDIVDSTAEMADMATAVFSLDTKSILRCSVRQGFRRVELVWTGSDACHGGRSEMLDGEKGFVISSYTDDRRRFALVDYFGGNVKVVEVTSAGARTLSRWKTPGVYSAAFSPGGKQVLVNCTGLGPTAAEQRLRVHDAATGEIVKDLGSEVSCDTSWSSDGKVALTSHGQKESILWDAQTWKPIARLPGELGGDMTTFTISPDGSYAVIARDQSIHLVSTKDGTKLGSIAIPSAPGLASTIKFVPGESRFAVLWRDGRIDYFDPVALKTELARIGLGW